MGLEPGFLLGLAAAGMGATYAAWCAWTVLARPMGDDALQEPYLAIREGAGAFLRTQYGTIAAAGVPIFAILLVAPRLGTLTALGFAIGGLCSGASGIIGMLVSVRANVRTAAAAREGVGPALSVAQRAGSVTGFLVGALALASVCGFYALLRAANGPGPVDLRPLAGLGFGASLISIFARLGGGIFTKAADVGADLAGKIEQGIPEDDPRNPAVIADNVGDNVGDCAGMAADVFESYAVTLVATMLVAAWVLPGNAAAQQYPAALGGVGLLAGVLGMQAARLGGGDRALTALTRGVVASVAIAAVGFYGVGAWLMAGQTPYSPLRLLGAGGAGLLVALGLVATTNYFTADAYAPVRRIVAASRTGHATNIITGLAVGMRSTTVPVAIIAVAVVAAYALAGIYGIAVAACSMLALTPIVVSLDAYGPITDNAGGIAEMAGMPHDVREATDALDAVGNTTKAVTKAFAIGSAGLAALVLFAAYELEFGARSEGLRFALDDPYTLAGLLVGGLLPYRFAGLAMDAVGRVAAAIVEEVRRQFREHPEILEGKRRPDHGRAVAMLTRASLRGMVAPGLIPVLVPLAIALCWAPLGPPGSAALLMGGVLIGAIVTGLPLALSMCTGGAAWDNAKKYVEAGHEGGKGSFAHQASITGDTVGDPYKDTAGPAINPMLKVMNLMAVLLVPYLL